MESVPANQRNCLPQIGRKMIKKLDEARQELINVPFLVNTP
jgi:hypothetical protein